MKHYILTIMLIFCANIFAQDYKSEFEEAFKASDTIKQLEILQEWEKANPNDPELFTKWFNYYFNKSKIESIGLTTEPIRGENVLVLQDSLGNIAGYLGPQIVYDDDYFQKGIDKINEGIKLFPDRLDMRFGKVYTFGYRELWQEFTDEIIETIRYSKTNNNKWLWTDNEKRDDGKDILLSSIQDYIFQLWETEDDDLLKNMRQIAEEVLKIYPDNIENLSNISVTYMLEKQYDKALTYLLKAEKIDIKDTVVLMNIARCYALKGDKKKSAEYYKKAIKYGDKKTIEKAKYFLKELKK